MGVGFWPGVDDVFVDGTIGCTRASGLDYVWNMPEHALSRGSIWNLCGLLPPTTTQ